MSDVGFREYRIECENKKTFTVTARSNLEAGSMALNMMKEKGEVTHAIAIWQISEPQKQQLRTKKGVTIKTCERIPPRKRELFTLWD